MWHLVGRRGLVVAESVVTRRLGHVEGITMNLETVRFPGEYLLHREDLEGRGSCIQCLRQGSLLNFFVIFQPLRYTCRRNHRVLKRRLVQPRDSVSHLRAAQVQQRRPGRSFCLSWVDFKLSLLCSHSLFEDLVLCCWDLLMFTLVVLVIRNGSLVIRIHSRGEVDRRRISGRQLYWWLSREWRTWSGISGITVTPGLSHGSPDPSNRRPRRSLWSPGLGSPGTSLWSSRLRVWSPGCWVMSGSRHWRRNSRAGRGIWIHTLVHPTL